MQAVQCSGLQLKREPEETRCRRHRRIFCGWPALFRFPVQDQHYTNDAGECGFRFLDGGRGKCAVQMIMMMVTMRSRDDLIMG